MAAITVVARLFVALNIGLDGDEAYYVMWSAWPAAGYLDHPPAIALLIGAGTALAGDTWLGVRLLPLLAGVATLAALYRTGRLLLPGRVPAALAVVWYCLGLQAAVSFVATPDAPSTLFWMLALWATAEAVARRQPGWWLLVGLFAGAGLASKYTNAWLGLGLVLYLVGTAEGRAQLRLWQPWAGGGLALLAFAPVLWWNAVHDWRSFRFQGARLVGSDAAPPGSLLAEFAISQAAVMGPVLFAFALAGIVAFLLGRLRRWPFRLALPVLTSLPLLAYFTVHALHSRVEVNWLAPVTPVLALVAVGFACGLPGRLWAGLGTALQVGLGVVLIGVAYVQAVYHPLVLGGTDRSRMLRGWETLAAEVRQLADEAGAEAIWTDTDYRLTGELFFYGRQAGDLRPVRDLVPQPRYDFIPAADRHPRLATGVLIRAVPSPEAAAALPPRREFASTQLLAVVERDDGSGLPNRYAVFAVSGPTSAFPGAE